MNSPQQTHNAGIFLSCDLIIGVICPIRTLSAYKVFSQRKLASSYECICPIAIATSRGLPAVHCRKAQRGATGPIARLTNTFLSSLTEEYLQRDLIAPELGTCVLGQNDTRSKDELDQTLYSSIYTYILKISQNRQLEGHSIEE